MGVFMKFIIFILLDILSMILMTNRPAAAHHLSLFFNIDIPLMNVSAMRSFLFPFFFVYLCVFFTY